MFTRSRLALAAATALTAFATPANAQQIDRIVAFGDSYADDDNFFALAGINPLTGTSGVYTTGRFSGGSNYIDTLGEILHVPIDNFAIGGARADNTNQNNPFTWGFTYEVDQFLNVGAQSAVFPATSSFAEGDLLAVSIGGNDARNYQLTGGLLPGAPAAAAVAAAAATGNLNRLVAAGAPTISFLAGDTGRLPEIAGTLPANIAAQQVRSSFSTTFNTAMQSTLSGYAANGVIVHYLDLNLVLDNIAANPGAYGMTNGLACPALPNPTCVINSSGYLFYADQLHLTSGGFDIVAKYVATQLAAPLTLQAPSEAGMNAGQQFGRTLTGRLDLSAPRDGDMPEGINAYLVGDSYSRTISGSRGNQPFDSDSVGVTVGAD
ncbi:MAG: SGNH/GDSL hydrolase family protein, partial [Hyphomicrobium sp.]|nr:SGNH/GDSL hydrolase family protein [Hyphomicrobium sp.]